MAAKKKADKAYGSKTSFVMGLPRELSAKDVVEKAKAKGIVISEAHVYKIRSTNKDKKAKVPAKAKAISAKAPKAKAMNGKRGAGMAAPAASSSLSKRDFVLSFDASTAASEILKKAKASGISLSKAYLYTIRSGAGKGRKSVSKSTAKSVAAAVLPRGKRAADLESQLIDAALELGLSRATELLSRVRSKLKDI